MVGVQPFGGSGLSGTGPKAGGPLYLGRLLAVPPATALDGLTGGEAPPAARAYADWLHGAGHAAEAERCRADLAQSRLGALGVLPGPVGERNVYALRPRGPVAAAGDGACRAADPGRRHPGDRQRRPWWSAPPPRPSPACRPRWRRRCWSSTTGTPSRGLRGVLFEGDAEALGALSRRVAARPGPILALEAVRSAEREPSPLVRLLEECSVSTNTAAAGGNASLMSIG